MSSEDLLPLNIGLVASKVNNTGQFLGMAYSCNERWRYNNGTYNIQYIYLYLCYIHTYITESESFRSGLWDITSYYTRVKVDL